MTVDPRAAQIAAAYGRLVAMEVAEELVRIAERLGAEPFDLANLIHFESGWNPAARNTKSDASGLIQFIPSTAAKLGTTTSKIRAMPALQQLALVEAYLRAAAAGRALRPAYRLYMAVFYPAAMDWPEGTAFPASVQRANPGIKTPADYVRKATAKGKLPSTTAQAVAAAQVRYGRCWSSANPEAGSAAAPIHPDAPCFTAAELGADKADAAAKVRLAELAIRLQQIRDLVGPLRVNSGFRTADHNAKIGGSATSVHLLGLGVDVSPQAVTNRELAALLFSMRSSIPFDQVIWYDNTTHVHLGLRGSNGGVRSEFLQATKASELAGLGAAAGGKTTYRAWAPTPDEQDAVAQKYLALPHRAATDLEEPRILPRLA